MEQLRRFTSFEEESFRGKHPLEALAEYLKKPGSVSTVLDVVGQLVPQYGPILRVVGAAIDSSQVLQQPFDLSGLDEQEARQLIEALRRNKGA